MNKKAVTPLQFSEAFVSQLRRLAELDATNRTAGADLRFDAYRIARHPAVAWWLQESDDLVERLPGAHRLRRRRRRGILRHTDTPDIGMPFFVPLLEYYRTNDAPDPRALPLKDELEFHIVSGRTVNGRWRPLKDELTFDDARAIAGLKAGTLYRLTALRLVPGQIWRELNNADVNLRELRFSTDEFLSWSQVNVC